MHISSIEIGLTVPFDCGFIEKRPITRLMTEIMQRTIQFRRLNVTLARNIWIFILKSTSSDHDR